MSRRSRLRRPLKLSPRGSFVFTPTTISIDVSPILGDESRRLTLHVGRGKGAIEPSDGSPAWEVDAVGIVGLLESLDSLHRMDATIAGRPLPSSVIDDARWQYLRRTARALLSSPDLGAPFVGRSRRAFPSKLEDSIHISLWIAGEPLECLIEERLATFDTQGRPIGIRRIEKPVSRREAIDWLVANGYRDIPVELVERR